MGRGWENDMHGLVFKSSEIKLYRPSHSYGMKISQIHRQSGIMRILTYSLPLIEYVERQIGRRPFGIEIICHQKFVDRAKRIKRTFPRVDVAVLDTMHSKVIAIEPKTLYIGSENFGDSGWFETCIGIRSKEAHDYFVANIFDKAWEIARIVDL